jgi:hypothetical protein
MIVWLTVNGLIVLLTWAILGAVFITVLIFLFTRPLPKFRSKNHSIKSIQASNDQISKAPLRRPIGPEEASFRTTSLSSAFSSKCDKRLPSTAETVEEGSDESTESSYLLGLNSGSMGKSGNFSGSSMPSLTDSLRSTPCVALLSQLLSGRKLLLHSFGGGSEAPVRVRLALQEGCWLVYSSRLRLLAPRRAGRIDLRHVTSITAGQYSRDKLHAASMHGSLMIYC